MDCCPTCGITFFFDDAIQETYRRLAMHRLENLRDAGEAVSVALGVRCVTAGIAAVCGFVMLAQGGITLIACAVSLGLMLTLIGKLFRCLIAIQALLQRIARAVEKPELPEEWRRDGRAVFPGNCGLLVCVSILPSVARQCPCKRTPVC